TTSGLRRRSARRRAASGRPARTSGSLLPLLLFLLALLRGRGVLRAAALLLFLLLALLLGRDSRRHEGRRGVQLKATRAVPHGRAQCLARRRRGCGEESGERPRQRGGAA